VHVIILHDRDEAYVDGHKLSFDRCDIHGSTLELFYYVVVVPNVGYGMCNIKFFNPAVHNNSCIVWGVLKLMKGLVKMLNMFMNIFRGGR